MARADLFCFSVLNSGGRTTIDGMTHANAEYQIEKSITEKKVDRITWPRVSALKIVILL